MSFWAPRVKLYVELSKEPATCRAPSTGAALDDDSDGSGSAKGMPTNQTRFRNGVVKNDNQACTITGYQEGAGDPIAAAHIFPVSKLKLWNDEGYARWITDTNNPKTIGPSKLFSRQNGIALAPTIHGLWDRSLFSVNPDRDYKSVWFIEDRNNLPGRTLAPSTRNCNDPNNRVSDECLRWHFHQAVLTNMRGAGERPWDLKPDEEDEIELMMDKENADEILEEVLANRLGPFIKDNEEDGDDDDDHDGYHNYYGYYDDHDRDAQ
ncbi:hypothetical protein BDW74DRAFT_173992 [Aspergillus multicolor]|uniref:uncharacterized protein n=1 Tax=Aspergillus multicolor TaxID=41759 RepID=UPI003CCDB28C